MGSAQKNPLIIMEDPGNTSGNHPWKGTSPMSAPRPMMKQATANIRNSGFSIKRVWMFASLIIAKRFELPVKINIIKTPNKTKRALTAVIIKYLRLLLLTVCSDYERLILLKRQPSILRRGRCRTNRVKVGVLTCNKEKAVRRSYTYLVSTYRLSQL